MAPSPPPDDREVLAAVALDGDEPPSGAAAWCGSTGVLAVALSSGRSSSASSASAPSPSMMTGSSSSSMALFARPASAEVALIDLERPQVRAKDGNLPCECFFRNAVSIPMFFFDGDQKGREKKTQKTRKKKTLLFLLNRTTRSCASPAAPSPSRTSSGALRVTASPWPRGPARAKSSCGPLPLLPLLLPFLFLLPLLLLESPSRPRRRRPTRAAAGSARPSTAEEEASPRLVALLLLLLLLASRPCAGSARPTAGAGKEKEKDKRRKWKRKRRK